MRALREGQVCMLPGGPDSGAGVGWSGVAHGKRRPGSQDGPRTRPRASVHPVGTRWITCEARHPLLIMKPIPRVGGTS